MTVSANKLFVAGYINRAGGANATNLAMWDGANWHAVGDVMRLSEEIYRPAVPGFIESMTVSGADLYIFGWFNQIGSVNATNIAKWDGNAWFPVGAGFNLNIDQDNDAGDLTAISLLGTNVYVAGRFNMVRDWESKKVLGFDGGNWSTLGSPFREEDRVFFLASTERSLYAAGFISITNSAGNIANGIVRWDGSDWWPLGDGLRYLSTHGHIRAMLAGKGKVYVGGYFTEAGGLSSPLFALWHEPQPVVSIPRSLPPRPVRLPPVPGGVSPPIAR